MDWPRRRPTAGATPDDEGRRLALVEGSPAPQPEVNHAGPTAAAGASVQGPDGRLRRRFPPPLRLLEVRGRRMSAPSSGRRDPTRLARPGEPA